MLGSENYKLAMFIVWAFDAQVNQILDVRDIFYFTFFVSHIFQFFSKFTYKLCSNSSPNSLYFVKNCTSLSSLHHLFTLTLQFSNTLKFIFLFSCFNAIMILSIKFSTLISRCFWSLFWLHIVALQDSNNISK